MRVLLSIAVYAAFVVLGGALLAPPLWWLAQAGADLWPSLAQHPFHRYVNRAVLVSALVGLIPFLRALRLQSLADLGIDPNPQWRRDVLAGLGISITGLWCVGIVLLITGGMTLHAPLRWWAFPQAMLSGVVVAVLEELFFRAALLGTLRRTLSARAALLWVSAIFAVVHYIKPHHSAPDPDPVRWWSGFTVLPHAAGRLADPGELAQGLLVLFVFGWILGTSVLRTRSLALSMAMHGGWVFALRSYAELTQRSLEPSVWIGRNLRTGIVPLALLILSGIALELYLRRREASSSRGTARRR